MKTSQLKAHLINQSNAYNRVKDCIINNSLIHKEANKNLIINFEKKYSKKMALKLWDLFNSKIKTIRQ